MAREGTRSATGHSAPRVFSVPETAAPVKKRATTSKAKAAPKKVTAVKSNKPAGVTKAKKAAPTKKPAVAAKTKKAKNGVTGDAEKKGGDAK